MARKRERAAAGGANPFVDPAGYSAYLARGKKRFLEKMEEQRAASSPAD